MKEILSCIIQAVLLILIILQVILAIQMLYSGRKRDEEEKKFWENINKDMEESRKLLDITKETETSEQDKDQQ